MTSEAIANNQIKDDDKLLIDKNRLLSDGSQENFIDNFVRQMEMKAARHNLVQGNEFIPGNLNDIVRKTGNKKIDLVEYLNKVLRKERFYQVKTDYLAQEPSSKDSVGGMIKRKKSKKGKDIRDKSSFADFTAQQGEILINITVNKVYVFHKSLKEIEEFFSKVY